MAQQYISTIADTHSVKAACEKAFLAGYKAAQEHAHAALEEAEARMEEIKDQVADADKVMPDSCEHILDMEKMVDVNGWISVKDGRPEPEKVVLAYNPTMFGVTTAVRSVVNHWLLTQPAFGTTLGINGKPPVVTHWQPLPEPPKEEE
ncbi:MAG: DUF551 domain-containing protein [bacterium]